MVAFRAADLQVRGDAGPGGIPGAAMVAEAGTTKRVVSGELMTFCHPVVTAPVVIRGGAVVADAWLPDLVRLGELERHIGGGVIEAIVGRGVAEGRMRPHERRRLMSLPFTVRLVVAMALMGEASYAEVMTRLVGHLADVAWVREWHVPASTNVTDWRGRVPPSVMEELFWAVTGPLVSDDSVSAVNLAGMAVCAVDGMGVNVADTPANRAMFGCSGTSTWKGYGEAPFPQVKVLVVTGRAGRSTLGAICGHSRAGEQTMLLRLTRRRPGLFAGRVFCFDRNFPGYLIVAAIIDAGGHVVARVKDKSPALPSTPEDWLPDGSRMSYLDKPKGTKADRLPVRVVEHNAVLPCGDGEQVSETYTLISTLLDHTVAGAEAIREVYLTRWPASETTFGENKTTIRGAGDRTAGPVLRSGSPRLVIQELWAWLTGAQLVRASAAASLATEAARTRVLRRHDEAGPITTDHLSFTASMHNSVRSMIQTKVTATTSLPELVSLAEATSRSVLHTLIVTDRQRHSVREQKNRPKFRHTATTKKTVTGIPAVTRFAPGSA